MATVINLEYQDHTSDKVYETKIIECNDQPGRYQVQYKYGRRWNANRVYVVPRRGVNLAEAMHIRDKQVNQKIRKGYKISEKY